MQEPSYLSEIVLVLIWFRMILTQIMTRVYLDIPINYQYLTGIVIFIPMGRLFDTIINVDS